MGGAAVRGGRRVAWSPEAPGGARSVRGGRSAQLYTRLAQTQCRGEYGFTVSPRDVRRCALSALV